GSATPPIAGLTSSSRQATAAFSTRRSACVASKRCPSGSPQAPRTDLVGPQVDKPQLTKRNRRLTKQPARLLDRRPAPPDAPAGTPPAASARVANPPTCGRLERLPSTRKRQAHTAFPSDLPVLNLKT